jgi:hypothetical protein
MPIRSVKQRSDRGSLKDLVNSSVPPTVVVEVQPSASEIRLKKLYEFAQLHKDYKLQAGLGIITTDYIADKNALPLSIYRIKKTVDDIKAKSPGKIEKLQEQFDGIFGEVLSQEALDYISKGRIRVKTASVRKPVFWRASKV